MDDAAAFAAVAVQPQNIRNIAIVAHVGKCARRVVRCHGPGSGVGDTTASRRSLFGNTVAAGHCCVYGVVKSAIIFTTCTVLLAVKYKYKNCLAVLIEC